MSEMWDRNERENRRSVAVFESNIFVLQYIDF